MGAPFAWTSGAMTLASAVETLAPTVLSSRAPSLRHWSIANMRRMCFVLVFVIALATAVRTEAIVYVTEGGGDPFFRDGSSWMKAFNAAELQIAVEVAGGDEIWVARGGYGAVQLAEATKLYGGFLGIETRPKPGVIPNRTSPSSRAEGAPIRCSRFRSSIRAATRSRSAP